MNRPVTHNLAVSSTASVQCGATRHLKNSFWPWNILLNGLELFERIFLSHNYCELRMLKAVQELSSKLKKKKPQKWFICSRKLKVRSELFCIVVLLFTMCINYIQFKKVISIYRLHGIGKDLAVPVWKVGRVYRSQSAALIGCSINTQVRSRLRNLKGRGHLGVRNQWWY
jgi:hypothetical protein